MLARGQRSYVHVTSFQVNGPWHDTCMVKGSLAGQTFEEGRERLVTVVDFPCAIAECCDYQSDCSSHVTI